MYRRPRRLQTNRLEERTRVRCVICESVQDFNKFARFGHFYYGKEYNPYDKLSQKERHEGTWDPEAVKRIKTSKL